ncbi:MAG: hypothetical protein LBG93_09930 [Treponema sp.]|jgi:hypothetical protein|nr:hypothetical protein [Treponema sp.]
MRKQKRLDGKKKLLSLTAKMEKDMSLYCRDRGIESENELVREAIAKYIYADYKDETLKLQGIDDLRRRTEELRDMMELFFKYIRLMHMNLLAYSPEIDLELADAAFKSSTMRHAKFFEVFQDSLRNDPPFFERLLHKYYTGTSDGQG